MRSYFTAQFCGNSRLKRLISGNTPLVREVVADLVPNYTCAGVLVNSRHYGGAGTDRVFWTATGPNWTRLAMHEMGHSLFNLADEYDGERGTYTNVREPTAKNVTIETDREKLKWRDLIADSTRVPTRTVDGGLLQERVRWDEVGLFEGAARYSRGIYRGADRCRMRDFTGSFCPVCEEAIVEMLSVHLDDGRTPTPPTPPPPPPPPREPPTETGRISIAIGGRTVEFPDTRDGTLRAIDYLTRRIGD